jgi:hypothetical protein
MNQRLVSLGCCLKVFKKLLSVADALENRFSLIPASGNMIKRTGKGNLRIPVIPATDSGGSRPPVPEQGGRV